MPYGKGLKAYMLTIHKIVGKLTKFAKLERGLYHTDLLIR